MIKGHKRTNAKKLRAGPGGWNCPCCNPMGCHPRKMKPLARRIERRIQKQKPIEE